MSGIKNIPLTEREDGDTDNQIGAAQMSMYHDTQSLIQPFLYGASLTINPGLPNNIEGEGKMAKALQMDTLAPPVV